MRVTLLATRLCHNDRFCLRTYKGEKGQRYFLITDARVVSPVDWQLGGAPLVFITPNYHTALAFMHDEVTKTQQGGLP